MAKKEDIKEIKELKSSVQDGKALIGKERVVKALRSGKVAKVFLASNCPSKIKDDILHYANLASVNIVELEQDNEELGIVCKKNFFVAVVGII
tara:strand:+ start:830 stop:1108 length:279 start_codon:yes stop_codon:yes gene_type:complete